MNLIPYNANAGLGAAGRLFKPSKPGSIRTFQRRLIEEHDMICTVRTTRGDEEASACGQLRLETTGGASSVAVPSGLGMIGMVTNVPDEQSDMV